MKKKSHISTLLLALIMLAVVIVLVSADINDIVFKQSDGDFKISIVSNVGAGRQMALSEDNKILFVGTKSDSVYAIKLSTSSNGELTASDPMVIASGLTHPNGVAVDHETGDLYIGEVRKIVKVANAVQSISSDETVADVTLVRNYPYPSDSWHELKYIKIHNNRLYVPVSAACNVCTRQSEINSNTITSIKYSTTDESQQDFRIEAEGVRNTVGFDWHPTTGELWFTDNGRDSMGDIGDELNRVTGSNKDFGFPYCHEKSVPDPDMNAGGSCDAYVPATYALGPHVAALGMTFYTGDMFPSEFKNRIFIAEHGSWDREVPIGYRITTVDPENSSAQSYKVFAEGWLNLPSRSIKDSEYAWGRPVDVLQMNDGSLLVSDDKSGNIYRITYEGQVDRSTVDPVESSRLPVVDNSDDTSSSTKLQLTLTLLLAICAVFLM